MKKWIKKKILFAIGIVVLITGLLLALTNSLKININSSHILGIGILIVLAILIIFVIVPFVQYKLQPKKTIQVIVKQTLNAPIMPFGLGRYKFHIIIEHRISPVPTYGLVGPPENYVHVEQRRVGVFFASVFAESH